MIRIHSIKVPVSKELDLKLIASKKFHVKKDEITEAKLHKKSLDARKKSSFSYVLDLDVLIDNEEIYLNDFVKKVENEEYIPPVEGKKQLNLRPIIIGAGPAGLFCAYELAKYGYKPIIIERGEKIEERVKIVEEFWKENKFNKNTNVQFGEGGAGTFSDGKLNSLVKDKENRKREVFKTFVACGAPEEILYENMPHIGTDALRKVIINLREKIISMGGEFRYNTFLEKINILNGKVKSIIVNGKEENCELLILAIGHSARETFKMLNDVGLKMESKPFAVGVRIIHSQELINKNQYSKDYLFLPPASYKLTYQTKEGRGVYSFCMCPGGYVVNARSDSGIVVNGMSNFKRDSKSANSAIVATISPKDYGENLFDGMNFQEMLENKAYKLTEGVIPVQSFKDYESGNISKISDIDVKGDIKNVDINQIFPKYINDSLKEGINYFDNIINGFNEGIILAPETRTSSPVRILRDDTLQSNIEGIYPCGEGSGYAGGITTSAIDGIKVFEEIRKIYKNFN